VLRLGDVGREVELVVPGGYDLSPTCLAALGTVDGIARVEPIHDDEKAA
jgi:hypothetical protein